MNAYLTPSETAAFLSVSLRTLNRWVQQRKFITPHYCSPRQRVYAEEQVRQWAQRNKRWIMR